MIATRTALRHRIRPWLLALALLPVAVAAEKPAVPEADPVTARMVVEKQLDAAAAKPGGLSGPEAKQVHKRYLERMGVKLETNGSGRLGNGS